MIYVTSDLHGCSPSVLKQLLKQVDFREEDLLFVLGDVIDRGEFGPELLLWLSRQSNTRLILGNHEAWMLACKFLFEEATVESLDQLRPEQRMLLECWLENGGGPTIMGLNRLLHQSPDLFDGVMDYVRNAPMYELVNAGGKSYILVHAGLGNFDPGRDLDDYTPRELLLERPGLNDRYFTDRVTVFGHTPTEFFGEEFRGRMLRTDTWWNIDTGVAMGRSPMLLRLEDGQEFYLEQ